MPKYITVLFTVLIFMLAGCRQAEPLSSEDINISLSFASETLEVGESTVLVAVTDNDGNAIDNATVNLRGDMSHAGMIPVIVDIESATDGVYTADFEWTMAGDWELGVTVTMPDGVTAAETFAFTVVGEMSDMEGMDMDDMDMEGTAESEMDMDGMDDMDTESTEEASGE